MHSTTTSLMQDPAGRAASQQAQVEELPALPCDWWTPADIFRFVTSPGFQQAALIGDPLCCCQQAGFECSAGLAPP